MRRTAHCCGSVARGRQLLPNAKLLALSRGPLVSVACSLAQALHTELTLRGSNVRAHVPASQPATRASRCPPAPAPRALHLWMRCTPHSPVCGGVTTPEPRGRAARQVLCPSIVASNLVNSSRYFLSQFAEVRPKPPAANGRRGQPAVNLEPPTTGVCQEAPWATDASQAPLPAENSGKGLAAARPLGGVTARGAHAQVGPELDETSRKFDDRLNSDGMSAAQVRASLGEAHWGGDSPTSYIRVAARPSTPTARQHPRARAAAVLERVGRSPGRLRTSLSRGSRRGASSSSPIPMSGAPRADTLQPPFVEDRHPAGIEKVLQMMRRCAGRCAGPGPRGLGPHAARRQITRERVDARHREIVEAIGAQPETGF